MLLAGLVCLMPWTAASSFAQPQRGSSTEERLQRALKQIDDLTRQCAKLERELADTKEGAAKLAGERGALIAECEHLRKHKRNSFSRNEKRWQSPALHRNSPRF